MQNYSPKGQKLWKSGQRLEPMENHIVEKFSKFNASILLRVLTNKSTWFNGQHSHIYSNLCPSTKNSPFSTHEEQNSPQNEKVTKAV
jgi:hypothetical protein